MEISIYSQNRKISWISLLVVLGVFIILKCISFFTGYLDYLKWHSWPANVSRVFFDILPLLIFFNVLRRKPGGLTSAGVWIFYEIFAGEFNMIVYGPVSVLEDSGVPLSLVVISFLLIGWSDIWKAYEAAYAGRKTITSPAFNKRIITGFLVVLQAAVTVFYMHDGISNGFCGPSLTEGKKPDFKPGGYDYRIPFDFQISFPYEPHPVIVYTKNRNIALVVNGNPWIIEEENSFHKSFYETPDPFVFSRRILKDRYGLLSKIMKNVAFGSPLENLIEIKTDGIWGVAGIGDFDGKSRINVYLWNDKGKPIGAVNARANDRSQKGWEWIYSIRRPGYGRPSAAEYQKEYESNMKKGAIQKAGMDLAFAAYVDMKNPDRFIRLARHLEKYEKPVWASTQAAEALSVFKDNRELKAILGRCKTIK